MLRDIQPGDRYKNKTLKTVIEVIKPLGNDCYWVRGLMGEFRTRGYIIRENYTLEKSNAN